MSETPPRKGPRYANALNKELAAIVNGLYRFRAEQQALNKLEALKRQYTLASRGEEEAELPGITLWVRNFDLSPEEEEKGYLGHYAHVSPYRIDDEDGHCSLAITRVERPLKNHPLRKRPAARCPNWGHPILRGIQKGKLYDTIEQAIEELSALHLEYPETTIPADNVCKLYLMIFSRRENPKQPLEKYVFEIKNQQGGGYMIETKKNTYTPKTKTKLESVPEAESAPAPMGHFASMVALKKKRKTPKA